MSPTPAPDGRPTALIFQKRLLRWSETFIAAQGGALTRYRPVFLGLQHSPGGAAYLEGHERILLEDHTRVLGLAKVALRSFGLVAPRWRRAIEASRPTIVHAHFGTSAPSVIPVAGRLGLPIVVTFHGVDISVEPENAAERRDRDRVFAVADRIIAVSGFIADRLRAAGCPEEKIVVHHIGIDTDRFAPTTRDDDPSALDASGEGELPPRILFVGRLVPKKGLIHLLRVMPRLQAQVPGLELVIAGDGLLRDEMVAESRRLGVNARFLGVQTPDQVRSLMRQCTLLCAPSIVGPDGDAEGLPMTTLEAQASGLPVVAFPSGGSAEGIVHDRTGLIAPSGDEERLGEYLLAILTDEEKRARFGEAARRHAVENFDLRRQTALLEEIYDEVRETWRVR